MEKQLKLQMPDEKAPPIYKSHIFNSYIINKTNANQSN